MINEFDYLLVQPVPNVQILAGDAVQTCGIPRLDALVIDVGCPRRAEACHQLDMVMRIVDMSPTQLRNTQ